MGKYFARKRFEKQGRAFPLAVCAACIPSAHSRAFPLTVCAACILSAHSRACPFAVILLESFAKIWS